MLESLSFDKLTSYITLLIVKHKRGFFSHCSSSSSSSPPFPSLLFFRKVNLLGDTNDTASGTSASVASLLALLVLALAEVVGAGVDDDGAAEDALGADQLDELVRDGALGVALSIGLEVTQVANVALAVGGGAVGLVVGVDWWEDGVRWLWIGRVCSWSLDLQ